MTFKNYRKVVIKTLYLQLIIYLVFKTNLVIKKPSFCMSAAVALFNFEKLNLFQVKILLS